VGLSSGRRRREVLAPGAAVALLLAACGQPVAPAPPSQTGAPKRTSTYTVRVQVWAELQDEAVYDAIRGDFNARQSDIRIENDPTPPGAAYYEKFASNLAAGSVADLVSFQGWQWQEHAARGALQAVDELAARDKWTAPWPGDDASELQTRFRGKRYLSPAHTGTLLMYYAREPFDGAGIPYPREGWTYTEFQDLNRRLTRLVDGRQTYAYQWSGGYLRNAPWWRMNRHLEWDRIAEPRKGAWNAGPVIEAFQYQLYDSQYKLRCSPTQQLLDAEPGSHRIELGGVAMKVEGPSFLARMWGPQAKREGGTPFDVQLLPRGRAARTPHMNLVEGQAMTRQSTDKEAAWEVLKWIAGEKGQQRIAEGGRMCNTAEMCRRLWLPIVTQRHNVANAEAFVKALEGASINLVAEVHEGVLNRDAGLAQALNDIRDGKITPKDALDTLQPRVQQVLDTYWATQSAGR
jgi:multiple sugar transport system substrate-binding protein